MTGDVNRYVCDDCSSAQQVSSENTTLLRLCEDLDQAAALARDCEMLAPNARRLTVAAAWWAEYYYYLQTGHHTCGHTMEVQPPTCETCAFMRREQAAARGFIR